MFHGLVGLVRSRQAWRLSALSYLLALPLFVAASNASAEPATHDEDTPEAVASAARTQLQSWDPEACNEFERSIAFQEKRSGQTSLDVARLTLELAECLQRFNDREGAYRAAQQARASFEKLAPDSRDLARALRVEGRLVDQFGEKPKARATLERALALAEKLTGPNSLETAAALSALGSNRYGMNDLDGASRALVRAHEIQLAVHGEGHPDVALASAELAPLVAAIGQLQNAEIMIGSALDVLVKAWGRHDPDVARLGLEYAEIEIKLGKLARADKITTVVLGSKAAGQCSALRPIALIQRARISRLDGKLPPAVEFAKTAVSEFRACGGDPTEVAALELVTALMQLANGELDAATQLLGTSQDALERIVRRVLLTGSEEERRRFLDMYGRDQRVLVGVHMAMAPENRALGRLALQSTLRRKGLLLESTTDAVRALRRQLSAEDAQSFDQLRRQRSELAAVMRGASGDEAQLRAASDALEAKLMARSTVLRSQAAGVTLQRVQSAIPSDAALIELTMYTPGDDQGPKRDATPRYAAYWLRSEGEPGWLDLGDAAAIDALVVGMRRALSSPEGDPRPAARALDAAVLEPVRKQLGAPRRILIAPDGQLNLVPFGALLDERGEYLIRHTTFIYLGSGRELLNLSQVSAPAGPPIIIANPDFGAPRSEGQRAAFSPLPGADEEATAIAGLVDGAVVVRGVDATKQRLLAVHAPSILHLATHGVYLDDETARRLESARGLTLDTTGATADAQAARDPLARSLLAFAGANTWADTSLLTALEASDLDLWGTKLVVLSACQTAVGDVRAGDGVYGLRRSFAAAGAQSLVMSLWSVDDAATRALMVGYYAELGHGAARAEALRTTQLAAAEQSAWSHPYYWAAFIASGDWRSLDGKDAPASAAVGADGQFAKATGCRCEVIGARGDAHGGILVWLAVSICLARFNRGERCSTCRRTRR